MPDDVHKLNQEFDDLSGEFRAHKEMIKDCVIDIEVAKLERDSSALRETMQRKNDLEDKLSDICSKMQKLSGDIVSAYRLQDKKKITESRLCKLLKRWFPCQPSK